MILQGKGLVVTYPRAAVQALAGVDIGLSAGELVAVVGPNGSGKTTLLRALLGTAKLDAGIALVDGRPVGSVPRAELARIIGAVPQREEPAFALRVDEFAHLGRYAHLGPFAPPTADDHARVRDALERADAWALRERTIDTLSGGEWQRVRVARALAQAPQALVFDEPTAALDVRHAMELLELTRTLVSEGLGALVVTHELNLAARFADRIVLLAGGKVVASGAPSVVLTQETLSQVFDWPVAVLPWRDGRPQVTPLRAGGS
jgi:iron complex transport system ATP-binding protein